MEVLALSTPTLCHCALPAPLSFPPVAANGIPPSTHPEATRLAMAVAKALAGSTLTHGRGTLLSGPLLLCYWTALTPYTQTGYGVWWHKRLVLLTAREEAWLYHPGEDWEAAVYQAAAVSGKNNDSTE